MSRSRPTSARGDINISGIGGAITATTQNGDVEIHDAGSDVNVQLQKGDVRISDADWQRAHHRQRQPD